MSTMEPFALERGTVRTGTILALIDKKVIPDEVKFSANV